MQKLRVCKWVQIRCRNRTICGDKERTGTTRRKNERVTTAAWKIRIYQGAACGAVSCGDLLEGQYFHPSSALSASLLDSVINNDDKTISRLMESSYKIVPRTISKRATTRRLWIYRPTSCTWPVKCLPYFVSKFMLIIICFLTKSHRAGLRFLWAMHQSSAKKYVNVDDGPTSLLWCLAPAQPYVRSPSIPCQLD